MRCRAILTTGIRARRNLPRFVKMESSKIGIDKFDRSDYFYQKDLHEPLLGVKHDIMNTKRSDFGLWKMEIEDYFY